MERKHVRAHIRAIKAPEFDGREQKQQKHADANAVQQQLVILVVPRPLKQSKTEGFYLAASNLWQAEGKL